MDLKGRRVVLLDGGTGQELIKRRGRPATPLWSAQALLDAPELVTAVHGDFIAAGARVITVNSYGVTPQRLARDGDPARLDEMLDAAVAAAGRARVAAPHPVRVAGCLPPLVASYRADLVPDDATCNAAYARLAERQGVGVDLFLAETISSIREGVAATVAGVGAGKPVWCAFTVGDEGGTRLRSGEPLVEAAQAVAAAGAEAVLVNCARPEAVTEAVGALARTGLRVGAYANGFVTVAALVPGGTVDLLQARWDLAPAIYAEHAMGWVGAGASIIGGCCEVGPAHLEELHGRLVGAGAEVSADLDG